MGAEPQAKSTHLLKMRTSPPTSKKKKKKKKDN